MKRIGNLMQKMLTEEKILADYFNVPESNVTKTQNEYIIITEVRNA